MFHAIVRAIQADCLASVVRACSGALTPTTRRLAGHTAVLGPVIF